MSRASTAELGRLRWRCRRGMKELDLLLSGWLDRHQDSAGAPELAAFARLLEQQDPLLMAWVAGRGLPDDPAVAAIICEL
ncbi:MAG: succinate dehydrogenase assembly factor 2, partial [Steroidobacteraceae bacterium]